MSITVRPETPADIAGIREANTLAFGRPGEARLVDVLREACPEAVSLVAVDEGVVVGHVLFAPVQMGEGGELVGGFGLGPVAVHPEYQRRGIGAELVREGIRQLDADGCEFVVVLGGERVKVACLNRLATPVPPFQGGGVARCGYPGLQEYLCPGL